jgi:hypothetical protein
MLNKKRTQNKFLKDHNKKQRGQKNIVTFKKPIQYALKKFSSIMSLLIFISRIKKKRLFLN